MDISWGIFIGRILRGLNVLQKSSIEITYIIGLWYVDKPTQHKLVVLDNTLLLFCVDYGGNFAFVLKELVTQFQVVIRYFILRRKVAWLYLHKPPFVLFVLSAAKSTTQWATYVIRSIDWIRFSSVRIRWLLLLLVTLLWILCSLRLRPALYAVRSRVVSSSLLEFEFDDCLP